MERLVLAIGSVLFVGIGLFVAGCGKSGPSGATSGAAKDDKVAAEPSAADAEIAKAMSELSAADRELAMKQKLCPVSGEALGSMGPPLKMEVKGQTVFLCCEGCKEELLAKPDEYLAKIKVRQYPAALTLRRKLSLSKSVLREQNDDRKSQR
jgi:YHS domain-containing protein